MTGLPSAKWPTSRRASAASRAARAASIAPSASSRRGGAGARRLELLEHARAHLEVVDFVLDDVGGERQHAGGASSDARSAGHLRGGRRRRDVRHRRGAASPRRRGRAAGRSSGSGPACADFMPGERSNRHAPRRGRGSPVAAGLALAPPRARPPVKTRGHHDSDVSGDGRQRALEAAQLVGDFHVAGVEREQALQLLDRQLRLSGLGVDLRQALGRAAVALVDLEARAAARPPPRARRGRRRAPGGTAPTPVRPGSRPRSGPRRAAWRSASTASW